LKDRVEPLSDNFETLFSEQAAHVGLCTFKEDLQRSRGQLVP
jgi:hypothetical protein